MAISNGEFRSLCVELWRAGMSAGVIAGELSQRLHRRVTRNAVIGQIHRAVGMGQCEARGIKRATMERDNPAKYSAIVQPRRGADTPNARRLAAIKALALKPVIEAAKPRPALPLPFIELGLRGLKWHAERGCAMILGGDRCQPLWCNAPIVAKQSYCPYHLRRVYNPPRMGV